jgi:hypothetical protein
MAAEFLRPIHVLGLQTLRPSLDLKLHFRALFQRPVTGHLNGREMDENIFAAGTLNKTIALGGIEPFHYTFFSHYLNLLFHSQQAGTNK